MKAKNILILIIIYLSSNSWAKLIANNPKDSLNKNPKHLMEINYGLPFIGIPFPTNYGNSNNITTTTNTNHLGIRYEYYDNKNFSYGIEYTFAKQTSSIKNLDYKASQTKHRFLARVCFHSHPNKDLDFYLALGAGAKIVQIDDKQNLYEENNVAITKLIPVAVRIGGGARIAITKNFGVHLEAGLGGPLLQCGLSFRF
jgi:hypothetical protein